MPRSRKRAKPKTKRVKVDDPPALRPVIVHGVSYKKTEHGPGLVFHMEDARDGKPCDVIVHYNQVEDLASKIWEAMSYLEGDDAEAQPD